MNNIRSNSNLIQNDNGSVLSLNTNNTNNDFLGSSNDNDKIAYYLGDGWCTFPDLDNFDSEKLLKAFTLKEKDYRTDSIWDPSISYTDQSIKNKNSEFLSISSLRQLEGLFNLTQLLFGLSRAETVNYTFRDLQFKRHPHSFKKSGFKLPNDGKIDFYAIFEILVKNIIEQGGLEVALLMYRNPMLPMVRQKCLDLISNVATVPDVAFKIMSYQSWFLDHLLIMIRDGDIVSDKIPALSVLIRLLKVMLTERMSSSYMKLVDMQYIDCLVDIFENPIYTENNELLPFFIKFEFITMQSLTVILGDVEYSNLWSDKAKTRLLNYCMIVLLKAAGAYLTNQANHNTTSNTNTTTVTTTTTTAINHIFYAEKHTNKHSLAHTIMTVTELIRHDDNMKLFYRYHKPFKQLIIELYKKYGAKSEFSKMDPGISYALNHLMRVLYIKNNSQQSELMINNQSNKSVRVCSNPKCNNEETKFKEFKLCLECDGKLAGYCSSRCKKLHINYHLKHECNKRGLKKKLSLNIKSISDENYLQLGDSIHQSLSRTKRLSKYTSMNERRNSLNSAMKNAAQKGTFYTKHANSMKEIKQINHQPLKTSTALCLTDLTRRKHLVITNKTNNVTSSSSSSSESQPKKKIKIETHRRRHSITTESLFYTEENAKQNEAEAEEEEEEEEEVEEEEEKGEDENEDNLSDYLSNSSPELSVSNETTIEEERLQKTNDLRARGSNHKVESPESSNLHTRSIGCFNQQDDLERKSEYKVIKEFERTLEFVKNASNLRVMNESDLSTKKEEKAPQITLASLCYDNNKDLDIEGNLSTSSDDEISTKIKKQKRVNLVINNSIDSQMIATSSSKKEMDFNDDEFSMFKNESLTNNQRINDYKAFKVPLIPVQPQPALNSSHKLPLSLEPIQIQSNEYLLKNNKIYNELKVFNNISNYDQSFKNDMIKNSTPIFTDTKTTAYLNAKHKQLINAKLDLTIAPSLAQIPELDKAPKQIERKNSNYSVQKLVANKLQFESKETNKDKDYVTSTLRGASSNNNLKIVAGSLDLSKLSAIENVVTSTNLVCVAKTEIPKDIKKCLKDEIKKDKTKCVIQ